MEWNADSSLVHTAYTTERCDSIQIAPYIFYGARTLMVRQILRSGWAPLPCLRCKKWDKTVTKFLTLPPFHTSWASGFWSTSTTALWNFWPCASSPLHRCFPLLTRSLFTHTEEQHCFKCEECRPPAAGTDRPRSPCLSVCIKPHCTVYSTQAQGTAHGFNITATFRGRKELCLVLWQLKWAWLKIQLHKESIFTDCLYSRDFFFPVTL